jgi:6-phosphofructokinase 1
VPSTLEAVQWVDDDDGVLLTAEMEKDVNKMPESFTFVEKAGPREKIFFNPKETTVAIITCGTYEVGLERSFFPRVC